MEDATPTRRCFWGISLRVTFYQLAMATFLMTIVPRFGEVYRQVKVPMSGSILMLVNVGEAAKAYAWLVIPAILFSPALLCRRSRQAASLSEAVAIVLLGLMLLWMTVALFLPLVCTLEGIGPKKSY